MKNKFKINCPICNDIVYCKDKFYINNFIKNKRTCRGCSHKLESFIFKFGEIDGEIRWKKYSRTRCNSLSIYIEKFGEEEGTKKFNTFQLNVKKSHSLEGFIEKYGDLGNEKWEEYKRKSAPNLENFIKKYGELGTEKWNQYIEKNKKAKTIDAYINKYGEIEGKIRWTNFCENSKLNLKNFIKRLGEIEGRKQYNLLQEKRQLNKSTSNYSKKSQEVFKIIEDNIKKLRVTSQCYYADKNFEIKLIKNNKSYFLDFCILDLKKVIEYNGNFWHANPKFYESKDLIYNRYTAQNIWDKDKKRENVIKEFGFDILYIWEDEVIDDEKLNEIYKFIIK